MANQGMPPPGLWRRLADGLLRLLRGTNVPGAWLRLGLLVLGMWGFYLGLHALIGDLPDVMESTGDFFRDLRELTRILWRLVVPLEEPGADLPDPPAASLLRRIQIWIAQGNIDNFQDFLVFAVIPLFWALGRALYVFTDTYQMDSFRAAARNLLAEYIPLFHPSTEIRNGVFARPAPPFRLRFVGGPVRLEVDQNSLAVMENMNGGIRTLTDTPRPVEVDSFEKLFAILDLREQTLDVSQTLHSREGVELRLQGARFTYRLRRAGGAVDPQAALSLVYQHWLGKTWESPDTRQRDTALLVRRELDQFFGRQPLSALAYALAPQPIRAAIPVNQPVLADFVAYFNGRAEHGLQLALVENGRWELSDAAADPALDAALEDSVRVQAIKEQLASADPGPQEQQVIRQKVDSILDRYLELVSQGVSDETIINDLLAFYNNLIHNPWNS